MHKIEDVKDAIWYEFKKRFPEHVGFTWILVLWMDDTFKVTLRHGKLIKEGTPNECELHMFTWYDGKITYTIKGGINMDTIINEEIL
jgi:hypothetical protein